MDNKRLFSVIFVVFVDLLGFGLILPLLPYYAETFAASEFTTGLLVASYAAMQLIGAPILGRLSDRFGRRPILLLSIFGTFLGFLLLGFANALWMLFASRIIDGFTGGNLSVAQAYISDVTDEKNRSKGLGLVGAAFGIGFIIGPVTGGFLSQWGYAVPAFLAAALAFINLGLIAFWLPESLTPEKRAAMTEKKPAFSLSALGTALKRPFSGSLLITRFFFGLPFAIFQTIFSLYALKKFELGAQETGLILTYVGVLSVFVQGFLIGKLTQRYREDILIPISVVVMAFSLLGWALASSVFWLMVVLTPTAIAGGLLNTILASTLTKAVEPQEIGGILGLSAAIESLTRVIAPTLGGALLGWAGTAAPGVFSAAMLALLSFYVWRVIYDHPIAAEIRAKSASATSGLSH
ncbi:MAG: MFS transporter [Chloroflexi bacterium HGW-Chloroflexi-6]|nr:MAG: MFS transporter [Chloroflexi bacterium HGW-Chloroflexi-6]